ncbi:spore germination protein [Bacillus idriensis]|uniref:Spore germination protein n=1 Tax=Metabacillus idriensis TaxID=324768 RepID=A0A6I2MH55_9BACI|nr:spore germination protein [Metabacillus idriensis]MRX56457.1 spore germination protein [Metabacillus idriensis]
MPSFFKKPKPKKMNEKPINSNEDQELPEFLDMDLEKNISAIKQKTGNSSDVVIRMVKISQDPEIRAAIVYIEGIVDNKSINDFLMDSIMNHIDLKERIDYYEKIADILADKIIPIGNVKQLRNWDELLLSLMSGDTIILINGTNTGLSASTKGGERRSILEPGTQIAVRGSRESFTESIGTNTAMVRRIIKNPNLWVEPMKMGTVTNTDVVMMYINGIAKEEIIDEVRKRLEKINIDSILESGYIEQMIEDQTFTTFPTLYHSERPDMVAGNLLEGRVAIFVDGTPFVLVAPALFIQFFQSAEDYYVRFDIASALRLLRILIFFISLIAPAAYVGATTFHQEMIPTSLLIAVAAQREAVPFPSLVEAIIMEVTFEILREAGIRMPKAIGSAISIVGALVIGQAAVQAGIVSPAMVIIVAITAIASFATPSYAIAISARLIRFIIMLSAATFGFYGIILSFIMLIVHLCGLRSFGVPYMAPFAPFIPTNTGDTIVRLPWWFLKDRPKLISKNIDRIGEDQKPAPPKKRGMVNIKFKEGRSE